MTNTITSISCLWAIASFIYGGNATASDLFACVTVCTGIGQGFEKFGWIEASPRQTLRVVTDGSGRNLQVSAGARLKGKLFFQPSLPQSTSDTSAPWWSRTLAAACDTSSPTSPSNKVHDQHRQQLQHPRQQYEPHQLQVTMRVLQHPKATRMTRTTSTRQRLHCTHRRRKQHGAMRMAACHQSTQETRSAI